MTDTTASERGAFSEEEVRHADRATPSVAEAGGGVGGKPIWMWACIGLGTVAAIYFIVVAPELNKEEVNTLVERSAPEVDRSQRAVDRTFPGTGFDLTEPQPDQTVIVQPENGGASAQVRRLEAENERLKLQLEAAREESAQLARATALRLQIEAAQRAEAERVKRLRSNVVIGDFSGKDSDEFGPRDLPNEPLDEADDASAEEAETPGAPMDLLGGLGSTEHTTTGTGSGFPPALLDQLREQGVDLTPGGQQ